MSREFYAAVAAMHDENAQQFSANDDGIKRHVTCRVDDKIYVYLHEDNCHIQTQQIPIPESWWDRWPSDSTVRRYIRNRARIGSVRITEIES